MDRTTSTMLRAWLHGLLLWGLLFSLSSTRAAAASAPGKCLTRPVQLSLGGQQFTFCAPTGLPSNLVKDDRSPETGYAQFSQVDGYAVLNIKSLAPGAGPGPGRPVYQGQGAAEYRRQVQDLETQKPDRSVSAGPAALLWGGTVPGTAIETVLAGSAGEMPLRSVEWYVEHAGRLWIFMLAWDARLENAQEWARLAGAFSIEPAGRFTGPDAAIDLGEAFLHSQPPVPHQAGTDSELVDVGTPAWWSGVCNDGNYFPATGAHSFPLGASWRGLLPCGPRPYLVSTPDHLVNFFPGSWGAYEFECVELVMRFLYQQWGIAPWRGNGNTIKDYAPASLTFYPNGTHSISPGDILTENGWSGNAFGHASVITAVNLDATGTGTINILEENAYATGARSLHVTEWNVDPDPWIHGQTIQGWLHHRSTDRVSVDSSGAQASSESGHPAISADGRYVAFESAAPDLVANDTGGFRDIFVHDRVSGETARVSLASEGTQANGDSFSPSISAGGQYVAFESLAANLVSGDTNSARDIFVHDRVSGETARVSVAAGGAQVTGNSWSPSISGDGRYVAFESEAAGLVPGDTNGLRDIFVHDRQAGETLRVSVTSGGGQANSHSFSPSISADGRYVAFESQSPNLVAQDTNGAGDIFVHDLQAHETSRVSVSSDGTQANGSSYFPSISADGRYVAFESTATDMVAGDTNGRRDVFVHDSQSGGTSRMSLASDGVQGNHESRRASISGDGRLVGFSSSAPNLVAGDTNGTDDVFLHNRLTGATTRASLTSGGGQGDGASGQFSASLSADGRFITFHSAAANMVVGDTNGAADIFVRDNGISLLTISGDAGASAVTLSFNDGAPRTATSAADGSYSLQVPSGWSGSVTPSKPNYSFWPESKSYTNLATDQLSQNYTATTYLKLISRGPEDGWVLESSEASSQGGSMDAAAAVFNLGDDAENKQYRGILSFDTSALPDNAVIQKVTLKIKRAGISGTNPFATHLGLKVDIRQPYFGLAAGLAIQDFQAAAGKLAVGVINKMPSTDWWYTAVLGSAAYPYINLAGPTQLRLRFLVDDNNDLGGDYLKFFSGNVLNTGYRPVLIVHYHLP